MPAALAGVPTGIGSLPGQDIDRAMALVFDALPDLPHLPELPARGPGSDLIGRTATRLLDLPVDLQPSGWRLAGRPGLDVARGRDQLDRDLDALVPVAGPGYDGALKVALAGPWTLAASLQLPRGGPAVGDPGASRDVAASLAATVTEHLDDVRRRVPGADLVLQLDEPSLPAVLAGTVATQSGFGSLRAVESAVVRDALADVVSAAGDVPVAVHCCGDQPPVRLFADAGARAVGIDLTLASRPDEDTLGELVDSGIVVWLGVVPSLGPGVPPTPREVADRVRRLWRDLGFDPALMADRVAITPACGLAGASAGWVSTAYQVLRQASRVLAEAPEGTSV
jgi:methionine synthase II (cobalamin-independent)